MRAAAGEVGRGWRWCNRNPAVAGSLAAVLVALMLGSGVAIGFGVQANSSAERAEIEAKNAIAAGEREAREAERARQAEKEARAAEERAKANARETKKQQDRAEWMAYIGQITLAHIEWKHGSAALVLDHLDRCQWNLRGWEYDYLATLLNKNTFKGHTRPVTSVAFSPNGKRIVSGSDDNTVKVWDADRGTELLTLKGHTDRVTSVAYSPDGERILTASGQQLTIWDAWTGAAVFELNDLPGIRDMNRERQVFSLGGTRLATAGRDNTARLWDTADGKAPVGLEARQPGVTRGVEPGRFPARHRLPRRDGEGVGCGDGQAPVRVQGHREMDSRVVQPRRHADHHRQYGRDGKKVKNARITLKHNGVVVHDNAEITGPTGGHRADPEGTPGPIKLQGHGNPLQFRNLWIVEKK